MLSVIAEQAGIGTPGTLEGHCMICGRHVRNGYRAVFSSSFTSWQHLQFFPDPVLCPPCHEMLNEPRWRRSNWLLTPKGPIWFTRQQVAGLLRSLPDPPFALYTTASCKKHGWIVLQQKVNMGHDIIFWAWDELQFCERREALINALDFAVQLLAAGLTKTEISHEWKLQHIAQNDVAYKQWRQMKMLPWWQWIVWVANVPAVMQLDLGGVA